MRNILILASAAALAAVSAPTLANDTASREVSYSDLDLAKDAGVSALKQRVRSAANSVCGVASAQDLASAGRVRACKQGAIDSADRAVDRAIQNARGA